MVIFTRNDETNLGSLINTVNKTLSNLNVKYQIIVADDNSTDNTIKVASSADVVIQRGRRSFSQFYSEIINNSKGRYLLTIDGDFTGDMNFIKLMLEADGDLIIASRYIQDAQFNAGFFHKFFSKILNSVYRFCLRLPVKDISSNFRLYKTDLLTKLDLDSKGPEIIEELLIKIYSMGYKICEVPLRHDISGKRSIWYKIKFAWFIIRNLFKFWRLRNSPLWADYDYSAYYSRIPLQRYWQRRRHRIITNFVCNKSPTLDIGCGSSKIIHDIENAVGLDIEFHKLRFVKNNTGKLLVQASVYFLPFKKEIFSSAIFSDVLEHIPYKDRIFREIRRVLRPEAILVIATPDYSRPFWLFLEWFYNRILPEAYGKEHQFRYSLGSLLPLLKRFDFVIQQKQYIMGAELIAKFVRM